MLIDDLINWRIIWLIGLLFHGIVVWTQVLSCCVFVYVLL